MPDRETPQLLGFLKWEGDKVITPRQLEKGAEGVGKSFSNPNILVRGAGAAGQPPGGRWLAGSRARGRPTSVCFPSVEAGRPESRQLCRRVSRGSGPLPPPARSPSERGVGAAAWMLRLCLCIYGALKMFVRTHKHARADALLTQCTVESTVTNRLRPQ